MATFLIFRETKPWYEISNLQFHFCEQRLEHFEIYLTGYDIMLAPTPPLKLQLHVQTVLTSLLCLLKHLCSNTHHPGLLIRVCNQKSIFLFLNRNICCGYSKERSQWDSSFEHPKQIFKLMDKKISTILCPKFVFICRPDTYNIGKKQ